MARDFEIRDPNEVLHATPLEQLYSDASTPVALTEADTEPTQQKSANDVIDALEYLTDELTAALNDAQTLLTDFAVETEYAELSGETPTAEFDNVERQKLRHIRTSVNESVRMLAKLAGE